MSFSSRRRGRGTFATNATKPTTDAAQGEQMLDTEIKIKVREIQHKYCGASVETKLFWAIKETIEELNSSNIKDASQGEKDV